MVLFFYVSWYRKEYRNKKKEKEEKKIVHFPYFNYNRPAIIIGGNRKLNLYVDLITEF
jgi:hypothetical protein